MLYVLDTDTCSYVIRGASDALDARLARVEPQSLAISAVTRGELMFGLEERGKPLALSRLVIGFLDNIAVMPWDALAADRFARLRAALECSGTPIGLMDTMIAGHALALDATLVSNNQKHFRQVAGLKMENWST